ncbi:flagellar protein FlgN [Paenibacillus durus]|uniref:Flagellar biosynthesis protein FlgN n=1 Tax=Paenibacillus durus TaxID=44251 RepID=A0A089J0V2_PAEDU|nr:flagellar protein FlgN [Paenibacillus durus]AIQ14819.1 hypothetical protein PDUR_25275 [Paenibacillus durus]
MALQNLIDSLESLNELGEKLLQLSEHKKQAILSNDFDELTRTTMGESVLLKAINKQEAVRQEMAHAFMREKGIKSHLDLTISEISRLVFEPEEKARLLNAQKMLVSTLRELKRANDLNQNLVSQSLSFIDFSLNLLIGEEESTYTRPDQSQTVRTPKRNGIFDARA